MLRTVTTTVDSLARIIQMLSSGSMSGHLIARKENDMRSEEGEIFFAHGKVTSAKAAYRMGVDALNWMRTWRDCTFSFHPSEESKHIPVLTPDVMHNVAPTNVEPKGNATELGQTPLVKRLSAEHGKKLDTHKTLAARPDAIFPGVVPYRTETDEKALQLLKAAAYSRMHRHLFLLVDGHRSVMELIRLTGREKGDVIMTRLRDLEKLQIIYIPN